MSESVFNEGSVDVDFRVEGSTSTHAFFVEGETDRVGIGESDPDEVIHIKNANAAIKYESTAGSGYTWNTGNIVTNGNFTFSSNATNNVLTLTNGGNVGIGVSDPTALFEVKTDDENIARFDGLQGNIDFRYGSDIEFDRAGVVYITANNGSGELQ